MPRVAGAMASWLAAMDILLAECPGAMLALIDDCTSGFHRYRCFFLARALC
jgi:hypothetical protein